MLIKSMLIRKKKCSTKAYGQVGSPGNEDSNISFCKGFIKQIKMFLISYGKAQMFLNFH